MMAAVDRDGLPAQPLAAVGHEEDREVRQLGHLTEAPRRIGGALVTVRVGTGPQSTGRAFGRKDAGRDGVQADAVTAPLDRQRLGHHADARLGHRRWHHVGRAGAHPGNDDRHHRSGQTVLDPAPADRMRDVEGAVQHGVGHRVEAARREILGPADEVAGRVVEQTGERRLAPEVGDHRVDGFCIAQVDRDRTYRPAVALRHLRGRLVEDRTATPADHEVGAKREIAAGDFASEARSAAGHEYPTPLEKIGHEHPGLLVQFASHLFGVQRNVTDALAIHGMLFADEACEGLGRGRLQHEAEDLHALTHVGIVRDGVRRGAGRKWDDECRGFARQPRLRGAQGLPCREGEDEREPERAGTSQRVTHHCCSILALTTTRCHSAMFDFCRASRLAGPAGITSAPIREKNAFVPGSSAICVIQAERRCTTGSGVFADTAAATHVEAIQPPTPASIAVGTSDSSAERCSAATASARMEPD